MPHTYECNLYSTFLIYNECIHIFKKTQTISQQHIIFYEILFSTFWTTRRLIKNKLSRTYGNFFYKIIMIIIIIIIIIAKIF